MKTLFIIILCSICLSTYAQNEKSTYFGVKLGYNRSNISGAEADGSKSGFLGDELYLSLFSDSKLNDRWNFENELLFTYTDDFAVLEFPLHFKFRLYEDFNVFMGPKFDIIMGSFDAFKRYNFNDFGASIDIGTQYNFYNRFLVEIRYSIGLIEQIDDYMLEYYDGRRNTFRIGVGFKF